MKDIEKEIIDFSKNITEKSIDNNFFQEINKIIGKEEFEQLDSEDKAALMALVSLRASLVQNKAKEEEPHALWRFIRYLTEIEMPMQMLDLTNMLYPEYDEYFSRTITPTAFKIIQRQACLMLQENQYENEEHKLHLENISNGKLPYGYLVKEK